jgi:hypothetical protein
MPGAQGEGVRQDGLQPKEFVVTIDQADYHLDLESYPTHGWLTARRDDGPQIGMLLDRDRMIELRAGLDLIIERMST